MEGKHATIEFDTFERCFVLVEHNARNGTFVNNMRVVHERHNLQHHDLLRFGCDLQAYRLELLPEPPPTLSGPVPTTTPVVRRSAKVVRPAAELEKTQPEMDGSHRRAITVRQVFHPPSEADKAGYVDTEYSVLPGWMGNEGVPHDSIDVSSKHGSRRASSAQQPIPSSLKHDETTNEEQGDLAHQRSGRRLLRREPLEPLRLRSPTIAAVPLRSHRSRPRSAASSQAALAFDVPWTNDYAGGVSDAPLEGECLRDHTVRGPPTRPSTEDLRATTDRQHIAATSIDGTLKHLQASAGESMLLTTQRFGESLSRPVRETTLSSEPKREKGNALWTIFETTKGIEERRRQNRCSIAGSRTGGLTLQLVFLWFIHSFGCVHGAHGNFLWRGGGFPPPANSPKCGLPR